MATAVESQDSVNNFVSQVGSISSEDDEPVQIRRTSIKKRINLSDDESGDNSDRGRKGSKNSGKSSEKSEKSSGDESNTEEQDTPRTKKKKQRRVIMRSDSEESDKEGRGSDNSHKSPEKSNKGSDNSGNSSEDESRTKEDTPRTKKKKKQRRVVTSRSNSEGSGDEERSVSRNSNNPDVSAQQRKIMENLRADNDAESSEDEAPKSGRHSSNSHHSRHDSEGEHEGHWDSGHSKSKRPKAPARKSAAACRKAMQEERLKLVSESQRMVRESRAALPYHKPKQRSIKEFLQARQQPSPLLRGVKFQKVAIELIGHDLEEQEKNAEEFYKAASDEEIERYTPEIPSTASEPTENIEVPEQVLRVLLTTPEELAKNKQSDKEETPRLTSITPDLTENSENLKENQEIIETSGKDDLEERLTPKLSSLESTEDTEMILDNEKIVSPTIKETSDNQVDQMERLTPELTSPTPESTENSGTIEENSKIIATLEEEPMNTESEPNQKVSKDLTIENMNSKETDDIPMSMECEILAPDTCDSIIMESDTEVQNIIPETQDSAPNFDFFTSVDKPKVTKSDSETFKVPQVSKLILSSEFSDACLTPSDAVSNVFIKPTEKNTTSNYDIEDSVDTEDFHLFLDDSDDVVKHLVEKEKEAEKEVEKESEKIDNPEETNKSGFDLAKLYASNVFSDEEDIAEKPKELTGKAKLFAKLKMSSGPVRLQNCNEDIDLDEELNSTSQAGFQKIMTTFARHVSAGAKKPVSRESMLKLIESGEAMDDTPDMKAKPGAKMNMLKSELKQSIAKLRDQEFKKRQREYQMYENEADGLLGDEEDGDCKVLSDEELEELKGATEEGEADGAESEGGSTETEPELEDDIEMTDEPRQKSEFMDVEAEEEFDEEDDKVAAEERGEESEEEEGEGGESEEEEGGGGESGEEASEEEEEEEQSEEEEEVATPSSGKCKFQRIKQVEDSDEEDNNETEGETGKVDTKADENDTQVLGDTSDMDKDKSFDSTVDKSFDSTANKSFSISMLENPDLSINQSAQKSDNNNRDNQKSNVGKYPEGITQLFDGDSKNQTKSHLNRYTSVDTLPSDTDEVPRGLSKLIQSSDSLPGDMAAMCSGRFPVTPQKPEMSSELKNLVTESQSETQELAFLCSGQFQTQGVSEELNKLINIPNSVPENLADLCSGQFVTQGKPQDLDRSFSTDNLEDLCSGQFVTQGKPKGIEKLVQNSESLSTNLADLCSGQFITQNDKTNDTLEHEDDNETALSLKSSGVVEMRIVSDDEDDLDIAAASSRKGKRKLAFSDDEDDEADAQELADSESEVETQVLEDEGGYVDYDSEENEIVVEKKSARINEFFEAEAELSGESDWGSADEDEGGLDQLENELGDKEKFDDQELASQLGKIHARRLLDDDKRDVRLFQEAFLEDGDLHSENGGRQRQFRWKNADDTWAEGVNPNLSGDEAGVDDDDQEDSSWRSARLERETWLLQNKGKPGDAPGQDDSSKLMQMGRSLLARMGNNRPKLNNSNSTTLQQGELSPSKVMLQALKRKSGSFLARRSISMTRVVALAGAEGDGLVNTSNNRNFVFSTISPTSNKFPGPETASEQQENVTSKKRPMRSKPEGANQKAAKKQRVTSSIFQHLK